jgi:hypothetical protein
MLPLPLADVVAAAVGAAIDVVEVAGVVDTLTVGCDV